MNGVFSLMILSAAFTAYFALGGLRWFLGQRREALLEFERGTHVVVYLLVVLLVLRTAEELSSILGLKVRLSDPLSAENALRQAASTFWNASRAAVDIVIFVSAERAVLAAAPLTTPLSSVLGAATGWSVTELSIVAIFFMHLSFAAEALSNVSAWILGLGASLTPVPALRKAGAALLATYLSSVISLSYSAMLTCEALQSVRVPSATSPVDWVRIAEIAGNAAVALGSAATKTGVALAMGSVAGVGLAGLFGSIYISFARL